jgi:DNA-binding transcriptional LysR family regulator
MMKFQQLNAFKAVYELGTMTAAAEHIHVTQPAISRLISSLEHQLGFKLFQRIKGKLMPSDQGIAFFVELNKAFSAIESLEDSARDIRAQHYGSLHISAFPMLSNCFLPEIFGQFILNNNNLKASLMSYRSEEVLRRTEIQSCDVGFSQNYTQNPSIKAVPINGECVCIVPADSELASKTHLTPQDLANFPFISYERDDATMLELDEVFRRAGLVRNDILEVSFANVATTLVGKGLAAAVVDPFTAQQAQHSGDKIVILPFLPRIRYQFYILYPALRPTSSITRTFVDFFLAQAKAAGIVLQYDSQDLA